MITDEQLKEFMEAMTPEHVERFHQLSEELDRAVATAKQEYDRSWEEWLVSIPPHEANGVRIEHFTITEDQAFVDQLKAALNPQRPNRAIQAGTFTRLVMDGDIWMTDTPAEVADLLDVDDAMATASGGSALIVGLGLGLVVRRAIMAHAMERIDVVEIDPRIIEAVGPHYQEMAKERGITLNIHQANIHEWRSTESWWHVGWFDIWETINDDDLPEVARLRRRFRNRLGWFGAWAQYDRIQMKKRIKSGKWAY